MHYLIMIALIGLLALSMAAYVASRSKARALVKQHRTHSDGKAWHALPVHFGWYSAGCTFGAALLVLLLWSLFGHIWVESIVGDVPNDSGAVVDSFYRYELSNAIETQDFSGLSPLAANWARAYLATYHTGTKVAMILALLLAIAGFYVSYQRISPLHYARHRTERWVKWGMRLCAFMSIAITIMILCSVVFEAGIFFQRVNISDFLFGLRWSPQTAIRAGQAGSSGLFGFIPLLIGTLLITCIALMVAVPVGLMSAIYISEYGSKRVRAVGKPLLEILAGIPTVVYGFFAITVMAPFLRDAGAALGMDVASESALAAGLVMGVMIIPLVSSLSDDALKAVPDSLRDASYGLGATQSETIKQVLLPAALPGIIGGILLATSRAIGETMIVVMAAGLSANLTANPLESVTTMTVQIVALLVGDQEFGSTKTLAAFALGLTLFVFTLILNVIALVVVRRYRQAYE